MSFQKKTIPLPNTSNGKAYFELNHKNTGNDPVESSSIKRLRSPIVQGQVFTSIRRFDATKSFEPLPKVGSRDSERSSVTGSLPFSNIEKATPFDMQHHASVRTSLHFSDMPTITTGSLDLDRVLQHNGQPLGSLLLIEETGNTDFASVLLRSGASQSILHSRMKKETGDHGSANGSEFDAEKNGPQYFNTKVIVVGADDTWGGELPDRYRNKKQIKKNMLQAEEKKISVQNLAGSSNTIAHPFSSLSVCANSAEEPSNQNMKIAWRYDTPNNYKPQNSNSQDTKSHYFTPLDFTTRLAPPPVISTEIEYLGSPLYFTPHPFNKSFSSASFLSDLYNQIKVATTKALKFQGPYTVVRVIIPFFLNPAAYPPETTAPSEAIRFVHSLVHLARTEYPSNLSITMGLALELFPRETYLTRWLEISSDAVIHIEPFGEQQDSSPGSMQSSRKSSKMFETKQKEYQGLIHVYKVPRLCEKGGMHVCKSEYAFRVNKTEFEIEEWGIPVEDQHGQDNLQIAAEDSKLTRKKSVKNKDSVEQAGTHGSHKKKRSKKPKRKAGPPSISELSFKNLDF